ncbi:hypothetical protein TNCV_4419701 [Trichonephila clavipes]|nr:hypothetical protein TNCV_4419701 [Trichonephila clavipes]
MASAFTKAPVVFVLVNGKGKPWPIPHTHPWYTGTSPGSLLKIKCDRGSQIALDRQTSPLEMSYDNDKKVQSTCKKCCDHPASPDTILRCIGLSKEEHSIPLLL